MNMFAKLATVAAVAGAMAVPMASPSQAAWHHHGDRGTAAAIGFGAGALVGAAAANAAYGPDYYGADYGYDSYAYAPGPGYAYAPAPAYGHRYVNSSNRNEQQCMLSPGSVNYVPCQNGY
ncbi:MAG TPA: hypothetical protein VN655_16485 [Pseudolabrys sp.]|nr:hypothetical protein [Pseudolabrys sp.]